MSVGGNMLHAGNRHIIMKYLTLDIPSQNLFIRISS